MNQMIKLSIIIPVYHEEKIVIKTLDKIAAKVKTTHEIIAVYDLVEDPTVDVIRKYIREKKNIRLEKNSSGTKRGVINAVKTGIKTAKSEVIVIVMADLSDDIGKIDSMIRIIESGYDIVCASRYMRGGKQIGSPFLKGLMSRIAGLSLHFFGLPTHDPTNAFKMFKKKIFNDIRIESDGGFEYNLEVIVKAYKKGYKIIEIPAIWKGRNKGKSKFKLFKWLPKYIKWYLYGLMHKPT